MKNFTIPSLFSLLVIGSLGIAQAALIDFRDPSWNPAGGENTITKSVDGIGSVRVTSGGGNLTGQSGILTADGLGVTGGGSQQIDFGQWLSVEFLTTPVMLNQIYLTNLHYEFHGAFWKPENWYLEQGFYTVNDNPFHNVFTADINQFPWISEGEKQLEVNLLTHKLLLGVDHNPNKGSSDYTLAMLDVEAVPEPGTLALLGLGLIGMYFAVKRSRKTA